MKKFFYYNHPSRCELASHCGFGLLGFPHTPLPHAVGAEDTARGQGPRPCRQAALQGSGLWTVDSFTTLGKSVTA